MYRQLFRDVNKQKHLEFATTYLHDTFDDVIWSGKTTVQLETHWRRCYRKEGERPCLKLRPKHPVKVHIGLVSANEALHKLAFLKKQMDAPFFFNILNQVLMSFIQVRFLYLTAIVTCKTMTLNSLHMQLSNSTLIMGLTDGAPPESPDMKPIENLWH